MNILVEGFPFINSKGRGIANYLEQLLKNVLTIDDSNKYFILNPGDSLDWINDYNNIFEVKYSKDERNVDIEFFDMKIIQEYMIDCYYNPSPIENNDELPSNIMFDKVKTFATIYDFIPYIFKEKYLVKDSVRQAYMTQINRLSKYDCLFSISENTKRDGERLFSLNNIINIYMGADKKDSCKFSEVSENDIKKKYGIKEDYLISVAGCGINKNLQELIQGYKMANSKIDMKQLVIVCSMPSPLKREIIFYLKRNELQGKVIISDFIPDSELDIIYKSADGAVFVSLYEGFGMPVIEAMRYGLPLVCSDNSSVGEIAGDAAILVNPSNCNDICKALIMINGLTDIERQSYKDKGLENVKKYSWLEVSKKWLKYISIV